MPATPTENPTRAALEAAVLDLTDEQIASALCKVDRAVKAAYEERSAYAWPREALRQQPWSPVARALPARQQSQAAAPRPGSPSAISPTSRTCKPWSLTASHGKAAAGLKSILGRTLKYNGLSTMPDQARWTKACQPGERGP